jgi:hypothetical protein
MHRCVGSRTRRKPTTPAPRTGNSTSHQTLSTDPDLETVTLSTSRRGLIRTTAATGAVLLAGVSGSVVQISESKMIPIRHIGSKSTSREKAARRYSNRRTNFPAANRRRKMTSTRPKVHTRSLRPWTETRPARRSVSVNRTRSSPESRYGPKLRSTSAVSCPDRSRDGSRRPPPAVRAPDCRPGRISSPGGPPAPSPRAFSREAGPLSTRPAPRST